MISIYQDILHSIKVEKKLLAILIDPDKMELSNLPEFVKSVNASMATHIFVGGSTVAADITENLVIKLKELTQLPILIFPGDVNQVTEEADGLLFLMLTSGRNPDYLIGKHVEAAKLLAASELEVIPTSYLLIENGKKTAVEKVTNTRPLKRNNIQKVVDTSLAGQLLGHKLVYLEAGSGANSPVPLRMISEVKNTLSIPLIVGGGVRSKRHLEDAFKAGADMVVIGTALEENQTFLHELNS